MSKQIISYDALLEKVQFLLSCTPECNDIHIDSITVLPEQRDGANWDITGYRRSGDDNDWTECRLKIMGEISLLRAAYDVEPKTEPK